MKRILHRFFDRNYKIINNDIYDYDNNIIRCYQILIEMKKVFSFEPKKVKPYLKSWVRKHNKAFAFNLFWSQAYILLNNLFRLHEIQALIK